MKIIGLILLFIGIFINSFSQVWLKISCGTQFTVALRSDSTLWSWGFNGNGQLGIGSTTQVNYPVQVGQLMIGRIFLPVHVIVLPLNQIALFGHGV